MKKFLCLLVAAVMVLSVMPVFAEETISVTVNGDAADFALSPIWVNGKLYVPVRDVCEEAELDVSWDNDERAVVAKGSTMTVTVPIGKLWVKESNMKKSIPTENIIIEGSAYMPLEALGVFDMTYELDEENLSLDIKVPVLKGKYFIIRHKATGLVLMPEGAAATDGAAIVLAEADGSDAQIWQFSTRGDNLYRPINQKSLRSMDMPNWRSDEGLGLIQYGNTEGTNQWVHPIKNDDGTYCLVIHHSMMYLSAEDGKIVQYSEKDAQKASFELVEVVKTAGEETGDKSLVQAADPHSGRFVTIKNSQSGKLLSVSEAKPMGTDPVRSALSDSHGESEYAVWSLAGGQSEYILTNKKLSLSLTSVGAGAAPSLTESTGSQRQVYVFESCDGKYYIRNKETSLYLTESYGTVMETIFRGNGTQLFEIGNSVNSTKLYTADDFGGRYYTVTNAASNKVMGIEEDAITTSALVKSLDDTSSDAQIWSFISQGNGRYIITNKLSGQSFDVPNGKSDPGLEIIQYETNYGSNQIFIPEKVDGNKYRLKCEVSSLYLTLTENGTFAQQELTDSDSQIFIFEDKGESEIRLLGAVAQPFLLRGEDNVTNAKVQWTYVAGVDHYDIYRSTDKNEYEYLTTSTGQSIDDYDLELGKEYRYAVYALEGDTLIEFAETDPFVPYELPSDLKSSSNLDASGIERPNTLVANDGTYYHFQQWGIDGVPGFGRVMMQTSKDDITYTEWKEVLNYKEILDHETCQSFTQCRFESVNFVYNSKADKFAFIAHFEADGGYGTAMISLATMSPQDERMVFHGAYRPEGDDCRDLNVFVDEDSSGYIIAAANNNANLAIYSLSEDWSEIEGRLCYVSRYKWRELPSVLKKDGIYYLFSSGTAGWYPTQGMVSTAKDMGGPWSQLKYVGNTTTFSAQSGTMFTLHEGGDNHIMSTYRWMFGWQDATTKQTTNRRYPVSVSNGYAFYDFFDELLYNWENDVLVPVQTGRILSQDAPVKTDDTEGYAVGNRANDGGYRTGWYRQENTWPYIWEADLGKVCSLSQLQISWLIWNGSEPYYNYKLEASVDGENYVTVLDKTEGYTDYGFTVDNLSGCGRYVRLTVVSAKPRSSNTNTYPAQLQEVKILGK